MCSQMADCRLLKASSPIQLSTMKKILLFLLVQASIALTYAQDPAYPAATGAAQNITRAEYFIDTDPGEGNGTGITITASTNINNAAASINVNGLTNGVHRLYIRTRNNEGRWSIVNTKDFLYDADIPYRAALATAQNITGAEYFIDTDPGEGKGTAIAITPGLNLTNVPVSVNTSSLTNGQHRLYMRVRNNEGRWSITNTKDFNVDFDFNYPGALTAPQNVTALEYFFDTDPGEGKGISISITPGVNLTNITTSINTSNLSVGTHRVYIRAKNAEGRWSLTNVKDFGVDTEVGYPLSLPAAQNVVAAEYFFDTDPGEGRATAITVTPGVDLGNITVATNTSGLALGTHRLYIRIKNQEGRWGLTNVKDFLVNNDFGYPASLPAAQNIIAAEYFIDTDPGFGKAHTISIAPGTNLSNVAATINTSGLSNGNHHLYFRTKNQEGRWSLTAHSEFFTDLMDVSPDTLTFGNVPTGVMVARDLVVKNNSSTAQNITAVSIGTGFSTDAVLPITINAGKADTIKVRFTPASVKSYLDSVVLTTSSGKYTTKLTGNGIAQTYSWIISPVNGYNYGNVTLNTGTSYTFTIYNNGNVPLTLSNVVTGNSAFVPTFTPGAVVAANGTLNLPVTFTPTAAGQYNTQLKILSSTPGVDSATTILYGNGYSPGTPPVLQYVSGGVYGGTSGVSPAAAPTGTFTYKILYKSANNKAPMAGYPKVSIDLNGNQTFNDLNEGVYTMAKEGSSIDYVTGVVYSYTFTHNNNTSNAGYKFDVTDVDGNAAVAGVTYKSGPIVTNDILDLRIFANDISFSKTNPQPGETFTMTARISNSTAVPATNVPIKFYKDTILIGSAVLPSVAANGSNTINYTLNFADEGFYPIKVWIDSSQTLGESNVLNNYAIRPVTVGSPNLPGGITVTTTALRQECPQLQVLISGHAEYFGTGTSTVVAGAEVTINTGTQIFKTTTDANGNYSTLVTGVTCGSGNFAYAVTVTDFTFTSVPASNSIPMPCPSPNACKPPVPQPSMGGMVVSAGNSPCDNIAGGTGNLDFKIKIRERDLNNMWSGFDEVLGDAELKVFIDGVLFETRTFGAGALAPGQEVTVLLPWQIPASTTPVNITAQLIYTYVEYEQIPNTATIRPHYIWTVADGSKTITPAPSQPDLTIQNFAQTSFTSFRFDEVNLKCVTAGAHVVKIFDGGTLVKTETVSSLAGASGTTITFSDPSLAPGIHTIKIVADADGAITETDETNNEFTFTITVVAPDLSVTDIVASPTLMNNGTNTQFTATIKNTGKATGSFNVKFSVNGVQVGAKKNVTGIAENGSLTVTSDAYTVTSNINTCGDVVEVFADSDGNITQETNKSNNKKAVPLSADLIPLQLAGETGSASNPAIVRVNNTGNFFPVIRNLGIRDATNVQVHYFLNGIEIGSEVIANVKAGVQFAAHGVLSHLFSTTGDFAIRVVVDSLNTVCESEESNNVGLYHIRVTDTKSDLEVLSQYISPSSLNPLPAQNLTIVGTVRNAGGKVSTSNVMRFFVDDVQLGNDVPFNAIQPGKDTTVQATVTYSSLIQGTKIMKIKVDPVNTLDEENEGNNEATRALIVGEAPDMAKRFENAIRFNPNGFSAGDSVIVSYTIINNGTVDGSAWVRFMIYDANGGLRGIDSIPFSLNAGANLVVSKKMYFDVLKGKVVAEIVNCTPVEYNSTNNADTLSFSTVLPVPKSLTINGNLDMRQGIPDDVPGWIGGKLLLGDYDLTVNGSILNVDTAHFIVTNGTGKLKLVNNNAENIFPVATDISHGNFVKINNAGTPDNFSVRVVPYVLQLGYNGDTLRTGNVNRTWFIEEQTSGGSNATVTFLWNAGDEQSLFDRSQSKVAHYTTAWEMGAESAAFTDSAGRYSKSQSGYTGFSPFVITNTDLALPLHLLKFGVSVQNNDALLKWQTTDEVNTSSFSIEHSVDGQRFTAIGNIAAVNATGIHDYQFLHAGITEGYHYYRLKMVDINGSFRYSEIKMIKVAGSLSMDAFPNPARNIVTVKGLEPRGILEVISIDGKCVYRTNTISNSTTINLQNITSGIYIIRYKNNDRMQQVKVMKE